MATGMYTQNAVLAALFRRAQTGLGAHLQIAMFDAMAEWMMYPMYRYAYNGTIVPRNAMNNPNIAPYGGHATRDGIVIFSIQNEREWQFFCEITLGQPLLCNHKDYENNSMRIIHADALTQLIESHFSDKSTAEVVGLLDAAGIANGRLNDAKDLWNHPQLSARDKWREVTLPNQEKIRAVLPPAIFSDVEAQMGPVPELGEHTESILKELKYDEKQINELFKSQVQQPKYNAERQTNIQHKLEVEKQNIEQQRLEFIKVQQHLEQQKYLLDQHRLLLVTN
jgi:crotonobetainyl-CoA:carnitine CoA-transferase CaiB-like acyl-CoA transferase